MKSKLLIVTFLILVINMIFFNINKVQAEGITDVISGGDSFLKSGEEDKKNKKDSLDTTKLQDTSNVIYNILLLAGMVTAVVISGILGIKFMIGSAEEKAQIKDALIPFVIGCIVIFGAFGIWKIFINIGKKL